MLFYEYSKQYNIHRNCGMDSVLVTYWGKIQCFELWFKQNYGIFLIQWLLPDVHKNVHKIMISYIFTYFVIEFMWNPDRSEHLLLYYKWFYHIMRKVYKTYWVESFRFIWIYLDISRIDITQRYNRHNETQIRAPIPLSTSMKASIKIKPNFIAFFIAFILNLHKIWTIIQIIKF